MRKSGIQSREGEKTARVRVYAASKPTAAMQVLFGTAGAEELQNALARAAMASTAYAGRLKTRRVPPIQH